MSRGTKSKAFSEGKGCRPQDESRSGDFNMADLLWIMTENFEKQDDKLQRFDGLPLQMQLSRPAEAGTGERKSGELDENAKAGEKRTNLPERQQQPLQYVVV